MKLDYSLLLDSIRNSFVSPILLLVSKLHLSLSPSSSKTKEQTLLQSDWSLLPEDLLQLILTHIEKQNCCSFVDVIHARSVCRSWRSTFPFPSCLLRQTYSIPSVSDPSVLSTIEKFPLFLFRDKTQTPLDESPSPSEYFIGGIAQDDHQTELLGSPLQCSVKVNLSEYDPILINMLDYQILPLGHHYRIINWDPESVPPYYKGLAFLQEEEGFIVLLNYSSFLLVLRSSEMRWIEVERIANDSLEYLYSFRRKFYAVFHNEKIFVIDPFSMESTRLRPHVLYPFGYLVPSGNEELFLVERVVPDTTYRVDYGRLACKVSKLDEETGKWVVVNDLGDKVLFIGNLGNFAFSCKDLPDDGYGLSGNSILITNLYSTKVTYPYKFGVERDIYQAATENAEDDLDLWRFSRENRVLLINRSPPVVAFGVERILDI